MKDDLAVLCRDVLTLCDGYGCSLLDSYAWCCMLEKGHSGPHCDKFSMRTSGLETGQSPSLGMQIIRRFVMQKNKITCDRCGADIATTGEMPAFRLRLSAEELPHSSNIGYSVLVYPPIDSDCHFCNLTCLKSWLADIG